MRICWDRKSSRHPVNYCALEPPAQQRHGPGRTAGPTARSGVACPCMCATVRGVPRELKTTTCASAYACLTPSCRQAGHIQHHTASGNVPFLGSPTIRRKRNPVPRTDGIANVTCTGWNGSAVCCTWWARYMENIAGSSMAAPRCASAYDLDFYECRMAAPGG